MKLRVSKQRISTTILISMTDVVFLLLIFLLIASNFASQTGLPIKLPGSSTSVRQSHQTILVTYFSDDRVYFMERPVNLADLPKLLSAEYNNPEQVVRVATENTVQVQKLINLMDLIRSAGFERIFVATEEKKAK